VFGYARKVRELGRDVGFPLRELTDEERAGEQALVDKIDGTAPRSSEAS
jgi:hypothetical protein